MMNSNSTPKIVVGIGLAVVFGVGVSVFAVRAKHDSELARSAPPAALAAPNDQAASDATAPTDQAAPAPSAPTAAPDVVAPAAVAPTPPAPPTTSSSAKDGTDRHVARTRNSSGTAATRVASAESASNNLTPAASSSDATSAAPAGATADAQEAATAPVASDSQITTAVKSEIASAAPGSNVDVTTTNGIVALAGSVPSQDSVDQARQAAQRIPGVKHVDASALMVSNQ